MPVLNIQGTRVRVDDTFLSLSPEQQNREVEEIAAQIGITPNGGGMQQPESQQSQDLRSELSGMTQNVNKAMFDQRPEWQKPLIALQDTIDLAANGLTMGFGNKAAAAGRAAFTDKSYEEELADMKAKTQAARDRSGWAGDAAELGAGITLPMGLASRGATLAGRFGTAGMQGVKGTMARAGLMGTEGAAYGGVSALGNDTDIGEGMAYGFGLGAAVPVIADVSRAVAKPFVDAIRARTNPAGYATEKVGERLSNNMTPQQAANRAASGSGLSLADVGGRSTRDLLRTTTNIPGKSRDIVQAQLTMRQFGQGDRLKSAISRTFADPDGYLAAKDEITNAARNAARPLYERAYAQPVHFSKVLEDVLKTPAGQSALRKAEQLAANEQIPFQQLFVNVADDGASATVRRVPDTRGWDYIKRALDDIIDGQTDNITRKVTNEGRILTGLKNRMLSEVDKFNPDYAAARKAFAGQAQLDEAMETGRQVFSMSPEALKRAVGSMNMAQKASARIGAAETLRNQIDQAGVTHNAILRIFSRPAQMKNLQTLFESPEKFAEFRKMIFDEARKRATYEAVSGNSSTVRQALDAAEAGGMKEGINAATTLVTQGPVNAALNFIGSRLRMLGGLTPEVADNIARQLMATNPQVKTSIIKDIQRIAATQASAEAKRQAIQAMISRALAVGGVPAIQQAAE